MAAITLQTIADDIQAQVLKGCGAAIEWTFRGGDAYTVSGAPEAVAAAVAFLTANGIASLQTCAAMPDGIAYDGELDESFAYLAKP